MKIPLQVGKEVILKDRVFYAFEPCQIGCRASPRAKEGYALNST
jgi:hypothetical protein